MELIVQGQNGLPKFWLDPGVELGQNVGLPQYEISKILRLLEEQRMKSARPGNSISPGSSDESFDPGAPDAAR